jgi:hypothetical protein
VRVEVHDVQAMLEGAHHRVRDGVIPPITTGSAPAARILPTSAVMLSNVFRTLV